ncbi:hypothetical protein [Dawidia cretensis]|uniref:hypothetical protein n=1 Tax=Dawidia cretensis TaxID=2782350 RepID=UPI0020B18622|nr:hypothetical protein [Dawidia cretensis]
MTSGPSQPEFSSFEPVATTNMVDEFTGDFTYNLPLLEVPGPQGSGYPVSLSYHSGVGPEEEASWVGYGWTLNPGAINRSVRGLPDDYRGDEIEYHNKMPRNWTATVGLTAGFGEAFGFDFYKTLGVELSGSATLRYNNYRGFGYNAGVGLSLGRGIVSLGYGVSDGSGSWSLDLNPYATLNWVKGKTDQNGQPMGREISQYAAKTIERARTSTGKGWNLFGKSYGVYTYTETTHPNAVTPYLGMSYNVSIAFRINPGPIPVGGNGNILGSYSFQENVPSYSVDTYGFLYSREASTVDQMDYHVEQEGDFNKRDVFLGVPFNDADNFIVTGEGIGGGFRLYNQTAGQFAPSYTANRTVIRNAGGEVSAGWNFGPGVDVGTGEHTLEVGEWKRDMSEFQPAAGDRSGEPVFFRFNTDLAGEWGTNHTDLPLSAQLKAGTVTLGPRTPRSDFSRYNKESGRTGRSSYIGYHTNSEMVDGNGVPTFSAYSKNEYINTALNRREALPDQIGELAVFNPAGVRYIYALPVYNRSQVELSHGVRNLTSIEKNYRAYANAPDREIQVGTIQQSPYATAFLLTEITLPDYVDRGAVTEGERGPSPDDLGGYTRFNYQQVFGTYRWRAPFEGMIYNKNSHSDPLDDMVSYAEGEKELRYLHTIETKTHVAFFDTEDRVDGKGAGEDAFKKGGLPGSGRLKRLKQIRLYQLSDCERDANRKLVRTANGSPKLLENAKVIQTVFLEYDYSLSTGVPNGDTGQGKLKLKRVYTEYQGIKRVSISPYEFQYSYPSATEYDAFPAIYTTNGDYDVTRDYRTFATNAENPEYSPFLNDAWGMCQANGEAQFEAMRPWLNQKSSPGFDPAAWHLKVITLPSGGQIHVQYEQDDYNFVQDQEAHVMATLLEPQAGSPGGRYFIDAASVGLSPGDNLTEAARMIRDRYVTGKKKIHFRFLYKLLGEGAPSLESCNAEYISGYVAVKDSGVEGGLLYIDIDGGQRPPVEVCRDFVKAYRLGKLDTDGSCNPTGINPPDDAEEIVNQLKGMMEGIFVPGDLCNGMNYAHSYFRIPTPLAKKGGGVRVRRLMMFDKGLEENAVLYGNEYLYRMLENGREISSGVATNEPRAMREENILVDYIARGDQGKTSKLVAGEDLKQSEGPLGESILPSPSIGYAQVITRPINGGASADGFSVSGYNTARKYPIKLGNPMDDKTMTPIYRMDDSPKQIVAPFYTRIKTRTDATQGFAFLLNDMHGTPQYEEQYRGPYTNIATLASAVKVSRRDYTYFEPGEAVPMMSSLTEELKYKHPGREVDLTFAQRHVKEESNDVNTELDFDITPWIFGVIPFFTGIPAFSNIDGELNTHMTTKVVRYPAILRKITSLAEGIEHSEEYIAFDESTGQPVSVRTSDEFGGAYLAQGIPANWEYPGMAGKWQREGYKFPGNFTLTGEYLSLGSNYCLMELFTRGDQIQLGDASSAVYNVVDRDYQGNRLKVALARGASAVSGSITSFTILHTGRTNELQKQAGSIVFHYEEPAQAVPPTVSNADRYVEHGQNRYGADLSQRVKGLSGQGRFVLAGPYEHMDLSSFQSMLTMCTVDLQDVRASQLKFAYTVTGTGVSLKLISFTVLCNQATGESETITAPGWE